MSQVPSPGRGFVGREAQLQQLVQLAQTASSSGADLGTASVGLLTGIPGVGKTALLRQFVAQCKADGISAWHFDCRNIEPTEASFKQALQQAGFQGQGVICLDHFDHFTLLDTYLRQRWLPQQQQLCLVIGARSAPTLPWLQSGAKVQSIPLDVWDRDSTLSFLQGAGIQGEVAEQVWRITRGHPLALELAINGRGVTDTQWQSQSLAEVIAQLAQFFLENVEEESTGWALQAAATVRRVTQPLLSAMLKVDNAEQIMTRLAALPLVEVRDDGLSLHPTVHEALAGWLRTTDPIRFIKYRRRAWRQLEKTSAQISPLDLWRYTADVIFLIDDPVVREAFFPSAEKEYLVEPFREDDRIALLQIIDKHDGEAEAKRMSAWMDQAPHAFWVARDGQNRVRGFYCMVDPATTSPQLLEQDPVTAPWLAGRSGAEAKSNRVQPNKPQQELFLRRWLGDEAGDAPSAVQAACWLDIKRAYLEGRPLLRRVYLAVSNLGPYATAAQKLGFVPLAPPSDCPFQTALLDFGPGSVDGWLSGLGRSSLGLQDSVALDADAFTLTLAGQVIELTPRELQVLDLLIHANGSVVSRERMMKHAWDGGLAVGSNVIDVLIRGLRKKLGSHSEAIETVRGVGYRWKP